MCDEPRPGVPRKITDADVERVIVKTLEETPKDATHWSTRSMAAATGMSQSAISRIWRAFALQPHRTETFKLGPRATGSLPLLDSTRRPYRQANPQLTSLYGTAVSQPRTERGMFTRR
ncbi:hypothetical protein [Streptomyces sp. NPDC051310]|uniref:hypothetical protein n=1 Tax=Streptomyces sp. NPDC051310 TaxID=3365649 RepID=UPI00378A1BBD